MAYTHVIQIHENKNNLKMFHWKNFWERGVIPGAQEGKRARARGKESVCTQADHCFMQQEHTRSCVEQVCLPPLSGAESHANCQTSPWLIHYRFLSVSSPTHLSFHLHGTFQAVGSELQERPKVQHYQYSLQESRRTSCFSMA